jgi:hypothetical protein
MAQPVGSWGALIADPIEADRLTTLSTHEPPARGAVIAGVPHRFSSTAGANWPAATLAHRTLPTEPWRRAGTRWALVGRPSQP